VGNTLAELKLPENVAWSEPTISDAAWFENYCSLRNK